MSELAKCKDCEENKGVFNMDSPCCRERHYRMTLSVSPLRAAGELKEIRQRYGVKESDRLAEIPIPAIRPKVSKPQQPVIPKQQPVTALNF